MVDPLKAWGTLQAASIEGWARSAQCVLNYWSHCIDMQHRFLQPPHQRCQTQIATGPSLTEKYGKRSHDIDPERDV